MTHIFCDNGKETLYLHSDHAVNTSDNEIPVYPELKLTGKTREIIMISKDGKANGTIKAPITIPITL